jgi:hypothetical protein
MDQLIVKVLLGMFLMTGMLACLNAWAGKWGPALAMLGLSLASFAAGLVLGGSYLSIIPGVLLVVVVGTFRFGRQQREPPKMGGQDDSRLVSERRLAEMNRNIAARKANRG